MNDRDRMLLELKMLDKGIVPNLDYRKNVSDQLSLMTPEESRRAKRKFRKLYKKAYKKLGINFDASKKPSAFELRRRQAAVYRMILSDIVS